MAKVNLKDATKGLVEEASGILERATGIRKDADALFDALRRMDMEFSRQRDEEAMRKKQQEQLRRSPPIPRPLPCWTMTRSR